MKRAIGSRWDLPTKPAARVSKKEKVPGWQGIDVDPGQSDSTDRRTPRTTYFQNECGRQNLGNEPLVA